MSRSPSPAVRGRSTSPAGLGGVRSPPSYAHSSLDMSPSRNPMVLDERPRVPPPIYLRSSSPQGQPSSSKGTLKIHIPGWGITMVRPPQQLDTHPLEDGSRAREPPSEDTLLSGVLEVTMKEARKVQAISVGVQSVCKLYMGDAGWEEDGVFERGVEVLGGDAEGLWLEKGSHHFRFSILLPATLATHDYHQFARISYIITGRVEGIPATSKTFGFFKGSSTSPAPATPDIPFKEDFDAVIARTEKLAQDLALSRQSSRNSVRSSRSGTLSKGDAAALSAQMHGLGLGDDCNADESAIALGSAPASPSVHGLYHRRQSNDMHSSPPLNLGGAVGSSSSPFDDRASVHSVSSTDFSRSEKTGWLKGDLTFSRSLIVHANPSPTGGVHTLDLRKAGYVAGIGPWRFSATSDVFTISGVILLSLNFVAPDPRTTIFFVRLLLTQSYRIYSPRRPNEPPITPESAKHHVIYQVGRQHRPGEKFPAHEVESLWRGGEAGGSGDCNNVEWKTRAVARLPNHDKIRPSTNRGTITPIRVNHEFALQVYYSVEGETVRGQPIDGPGELRMMAVKMPTTVASCCCTTNALVLPTYESSGRMDPEEIDNILTSPPAAKQCQCGASFSELGEAAMRRMQSPELDDMEGSVQNRTEEEASREKVEMERASSSGGRRR